MPPPALPLATQDEVPPSHVPSSRCRGGGGDSPKVGDVGEVGEVAGDVGGVVAIVACSTQCTRRACAICRLSLLPPLHQLHRHPHVAPAGDGVRDEAGVDQSLNREVKTGRTPVERRGASSSSASRSRAAAATAASPCGGGSSRERDDEVSLLRVVQRRSKVCGRGPGKRDDAVAIAAVVWVAAFPGLLLPPSVSVCHTTGELPSTWTGKLPRLVRGIGG